MALSTRAASGGQGGSTALTSQAITFPTGTTTNDLVYIILSVNATVTSPTATGWNPQVISNGTTTHSLIICYRTILAGDTAPTVSWTGSGKTAWTAVTLQPAAGQQGAHSGFGTAVNTGTAATTHTPPSYAAGASSGASVLLNAFRTGANGATGVATTAPTNWTEPTNGDQTTAVTTNARQVAAEVSVRTGQTGTITPGSETITVSSSAILQHAFSVEQAAPPSVSAGADASVLQNATFSRTATETLNGGTATSRDWSIVAGPTGVGSSIGSAAALSWTPSTLGQYTLRYTLVASNGTATDDVLVTVGYLRSETSAFNTTTAALSMTLAASTTVGDKVVLLQANDYYTMAALGTPSGTAVSSWTELTAAQFDGGTFAGDGTPRVHFKAWMGTVTTGGASTVVANWASPSGGDEERYAHALVFTSTALYDTATSTAQSAGTTWTVPSVTAAEDSSYQLVMVANSTTGGLTNFTFPAGMTTQAEVDNFITFRSGWAFVSTAGAIGTRSITSSASVSGGIQTVVIKPTVTAAASGDATLAATATIGAAAFVDRQAGASLAATAGVTTAGFVERITGATLSATGTVTTTAAVTRITGATLAATGSITAAGALALPSGASFAGSAVVSTAGFVERITGAAVAALAAISASGALTAVSSASLSGSATITTTGFLALSSGASLAGSASITTAGVVGAIVTLSGTATITAAGFLVESAGATLASSATISAGGFLGLASGATLSGTATVSAGGFLGLASGATLSGTATVSSAGFLALASAATVAASGTIAAAGTLAGAGATASLSATATISASELLTLLTGAALVGSATITAVGSASTLWGPPTGLIVTVISDTELDLSWDSVPGASGYDIERDGVVIATDVIGTSYNDTGLTASSTHTYRARSVRA